MMAASNLVRQGSGTALMAALVLAAAVVAVLATWPAATPEPDPVEVLTAAEQRAQALPSAQDRRAMLERIVTANPRNGRAWMLLAYAELEARRWAEAARAIEQATSVSRTVAADPAAWCEWADALGMLQQGSLIGRPTELIERALALSATHPKALEMAGSAAYERRDYRRAADYWGKLLPQLRAGTQAHAELSAAIARAEKRAGTTLPSG